MADQFTHALADYYSITECHIIKINEALKC